MEKESNKWLGWEMHWKDALAKHLDAVSFYAESVFRWRDDVTRKVATREFFERLAEYHGFSIKWGDESDAAVPESSKPETEGEK